MAPTPADHAIERPDPSTDPAPAATSRRSRRKQSIKRRVVRLVLVPSVVALVMWFAASGYLVFQGVYNRAVAISVRDVSIPAVSALSSIQQERRLSVAYLARKSTNVNALLTQRQTTDEQLTKLRAVADDALGNAPASIKDQWRTLVGHLDQLPNTRSAIDARSTTGTKAYIFYNTLLDSATAMFDTQARIVPDVTAALGGLAATDLFRASDLMSRAASTMDGAYASRTFGRADHLEFVRLVSAYHYEIDKVRPSLEPAVRSRLEGLQADPAWQSLMAAENSLITAGTWRKAVPATVTTDRDRWAMMTGTVSQSLVDLTVAEADQVSARTLRTGNNQLLTALAGSLVALAVAIGVILWALRQSAVLVDRALSTRLARLGSDAGTLIDQRLPALMARLRRRETVDLESEFAAQDYGADEIGQVADVIHRSLQAAAGAAVDEAKARAAGTAMLMGVARRPQRPLQRGLKVIEDLQSQIGDEKLLVHLFDIHHQLNQTRRFLENLVILAGGQIGRRFSKPVPLRRVLLASFAEARNYQRINLRGATDVALVGYAVAEVIHLMAELLDNALAFSPPGTTVWVTSSEVKHGVAVEIEDAGVGMAPEAVDRANALLATAPTPEVTELKDGAQVGLYVVAELAKREGLQVSLRRSAYGGLLAIVLLPERLLVATEGENTDSGLSRGALVATAAVPPARDDNAREAAPAPVVARAAVAVLEPQARREPQARIEPQARLEPRAQLEPQARPEPHARLEPQAQLESQARLEPRVRPEPPVRAEPRARLEPPVRTEPAPAAGPDRRDDPGGPVSGAQPDRTAGTSAPVTRTPGKAQPGAKPPLPHRRPQQHLAPGLREVPPAETAAAGPVPAPRSPEEVRSRFARYQRGWADGQAAGRGAPADTDHDAPEPTAEQGRNA